MEKQEEMEVPPPTPEAPNLEEQMEVNPHHLQVPAGDAGPSTSSATQAPKSPIKNFKYFWVEKVDNRYAKLTKNARNISDSDLLMGVGALKKRKKIEPNQLIK